MYLNASYFFYANRLILSHVKNIKLTVFTHFFYFKMKSYNFYKDFINFKLKILAFNYFVNILLLKNPFLLEYDLKIKNFNQIELNFFAR